MPSVGSSSGGPPVAAAASSIASAISLGDNHTCVLTVSGGVKCWGGNGNGQLGDGTTTNRHTPVDVSGLASGVVAIAAGGEDTCALTHAGGVKCWGRNELGQLGDGEACGSPCPEAGPGRWVRARGLRRPQGDGQEARRCQARDRDGPLLGGQGHEGLLEEEEGACDLAEAEAWRGLAGRLADHPKSQHRSAPREGT